MSLVVSRIPIGAQRCHRTFSKIYWHFREELFARKRIDDNNLFGKNFYYDICMWNSISLKLSGDILIKIEFLPIIFGLRNKFVKVTDAN